MLTNGEVTLVTFDEKGPELIDDIVGKIEKIFISGGKNNDFNVTGLTYLVLATNPDTGVKEVALCVNLDHTDNYSVKVTYPYIIMKKLLRKKVLDDFLNKISIKRSMPKKRSMKKLRNAFFEKGDCIIIKSDPTTYVAALVLESEKRAEFGMNLIALLDSFSSNKPKIEDIPDSSVLVSRVKITKDNFNQRNEIHWFFPNHIKKSNFEYELIGKVNIQRNFNSKKDFQSYVNWLDLPERIKEIKNQYNLNGKPKNPITIKSIIKKKWLLF